MSLSDETDSGLSRLEELQFLWEGAKGPAAIRMRPWAMRLIEAARTSIACGLLAQSKVLLDRLEKHLPQDAAGSRQITLEAAWNSEGLPRAPSVKREELLWRRVRTLRSSRRPYDGVQHPGRQGLAWGPYNRASAVIETLELAARVDPLWVDDVLERERAAGAIDHLLGIV